MTQNYINRLQDLEGRARRRNALETVSRIAEAEGLGVRELLDETEVIAERISQVGSNAVINELALEMGITPDTLRANIAAFEERYR